MKPCASLAGPKSLQTNTAEWVGAHSWTPPADRQDLRWLVANKDHFLKRHEQRTYAAVAAAAGVEPGGRLPSEDGDAAADRVAVVRLCQNSPRRKLIYEAGACGQ